MKLCFSFGPYAWSAFKCDIYLPHEIFVVEIIACAPATSSGNWPVS